MQLASAESLWKEAKEHFSHAKRRRKLAKLLARRAKTEARQAKERLANAREALAVAEAKAMTGISQTRRRKARKIQSKPVQAKPRASARKRTFKPVSVVRLPKLVEPAPSTVLQTVVKEMEDGVAPTGSPISNTNPGEI